MLLVSQWEECCTGLFIAEMKERNNELLPGSCPLNLSAPAEKFKAFGKIFLLTRYGGGKNRKERVFFLKNLRVLASVET